MSASTITCPSGHANSATQKFCGECGMSLVGVCPNGHQNPDGQRYCGECGSPLGQPTSSSPTAATAEPSSARSQSAAARHSADTGPARQADDGPAESGDSGNTAADYQFQSPEPPETRTATRSPRIGDELILPSGIDAVVVHCDDETVWLRTSRGQTSFGTSKHRRSDVDASIAEKRIAFVERSEVATAPAPEPQSSRTSGQSASPPSAQPYRTPGQLNQAVNANPFSTIAFVCAGLALLGGLAVVAPLPLIFGVAAIICALVALTKKEHLAAYATAAAVGGLILGWVLQAAMFNAVFY